MAAIRLLRKEDNDQYIKLLESYNVNFEKIFEEVFDTKIIEIWVVDEDISNNIIGSATILFEPNFTTNGYKVGYIKDIIIDKDKVSLGYDKLLVEHLLERAKYKECCKVLLFTENNVNFLNPLEKVNALSKNI